MVLPLTEATSPVWQTSRARSSQLQRDSGSSWVAGSSQAQALTCTTRSGGKSPGTTRTRLLFQTLEAISEEPFPPPTDNLTAAVEARGNVVVVQSFGGQKDHLGSLNLKIR